MSNNIEHNIKVNKIRETIIEIIALKKLAAELRAEELPKFVPLNYHLGKIERILKELDLNLSNLPV